MKRSDILFILALLAAVAASFFAGYQVAMCRFPEFSEVTDTTYVYDTIPYYKPVPRDSVILSYVEVPIPVSVNDSTNSNGLNVRDSINIKVAIERLVYEEDSTYYAVVSGPTIGDYHPSLDTLEVYRETIFVETTRNVISYKPYKWSVGPFVSQEVGTAHYMAKVGVAADLGFKNDRWRFSPEVGYQWTAIDRGGWYAGARIKFDLFRGR